MLTWPDVGTFNTGLAITDDITISSRHHVRLSAKAAWQRQQVKSDEGFKALSIYFPGMDRSRSRLVGRLAASYAYEHRGWTLAVGTGYGTRAPTVTESYGYFLNNTFDQYDYIGNPSLKNEKAVEANAALGWRDKQVAVKAETNVFFFQDYIIGCPDTRLAAMTIGAAGVKVYQHLSTAQILNASLTADCHLTEWLRWENRLTYSYGQDSSGERLPLIAPLSYLGNLRFHKSCIEAGGGVRMAARNSRCGAAYGETPTAGYAVWHLNIGGHFLLGGVGADLRLGVENLFDRYYSTYSDWNHIPQKGRNVYLHAAFRL